MIAVIVGVGLSLWIGPINIFYFIGTTLTLGLILVYSAGNLGVFMLYWRELRSNFNPLIHAVIPLATTLALLWVGWKSIEGLHITSPQNYLDWVPAVVAGWVIAGLLLVVFVSRSGNTDWLVQAGRSVAEEPRSTTTRPGRADGVPPRRGASCDRSSASATSGRTSSPARTDRSRSLRDERSRG